jgi:hypothetical protein
VTVALTSVGSGSLAIAMLGVLTPLTVVVPERFTRGTVVAAVWLVALKSL